MADLKKWVDPVNMGPFRMGLRHTEKVNYTTWSDDELIERMRELLPKFVNSWRAGDNRVDEYLLVRGLQSCPDLSALLLSDREKLDLDL